MGMRKTNNTQRYRNRLTKAISKDEHELKEHCAKELAARVHKEIVDNLNDEVVHVRTGNLKGSQHFLTWGGEINLNRKQEPRLNTNLKPGQAINWNDAAYAATLNDGVPHEWEITVKPKKAKALFWGAYTPDGKPIYSKGHTIKMPPRPPYPFFTNGVEDIRDRAKKILTECFKDYLKSKGLK